MNPIKNRNAFYLLILLAAFCSCQKVITVHLNNAATKNVIEGTITDQPGPYLVTITQTVNFDQDNVFPPVTGAIVVVTDNTAGQVDTLNEATPGNYKTSIITGVPGHTYQLYINAGGQVYTASSTMPQHISLDSLYTQKSSFGNNIQIVPVYTDPVARGNYYYFTEYYNDTAATGIFIRSDNLVNGQVVSQPLGGGGDNKLYAGDSVAIYLSCIDSAVYQYFYSLQQTMNQNSATPANPASNITGGALGYFSART